MFLAIERGECNNNMNCFLGAIFLFFFFLYLVLVWVRERERERERVTVIIQEL